MLWELKKCWYRTYQTVYKFAMRVLDWSEPYLLEGEGAVLRLPAFIKDKGLIEGIFDKLDRISTQFDVDFVISVSLEGDEVPEKYSSNVIVSL